MQRHRASVARTQKTSVTVVQDAVKSAPPAGSSWQRVNVWSPRTWLPVLGFAMMILGVTALLQRRGDGDRFPEPDRSLPMIVIDAGHGGHDSGAVENGLREKDLTLDTALKLERCLREAGFPVVMTRRDDRFLELFDRAAIANKFTRALFVSIHFNDNTTQSGDGVETFYAQKKAPFSDNGWSVAGMFKDEAAATTPPDTGETFARAIQSSIVEDLGVTDRGAKPRQLAVVRLTRCPAVLVEGGFLNNPKEARLLAEDLYRERLASSSARGVQRYWRDQEHQARSGQLAAR